MRLFARIVLACCMAHSAVPAALARDEASAAAAQTLVPFSSEEALARLVRSAAKVNFPALANQLGPQPNSAFCGPASAGWVWMPVAALIGGMRTFDTAEYRGYILVQSR